MDIQDKTRQASLDSNNLLLAELDGTVVGRVKGETLGVRCHAIYAPKKLGANQWDQFIHCKYLLLILCALVLPPTFSAFASLV